MCARSNPEIWQAVAVKGLKTPFCPWHNRHGWLGVKNNNNQAWFGALNKCLMWNHLLTHLFADWQVWSEKCQPVVSCQSAKVLICEARIYESVAVNAQSSVWKLLCAIYTFSFIHSFIVTADLASLNRIPPKWELNRNKHQGDYRVACNEIQTHRMVSISRPEC